MVLSGPDPSVPFTTEEGSVESGTSGLTAPLPPGDIVFFRVAGRNPVCGIGAQE